MENWLRQSFFDAFVPMERRQEAIAEAGPE